MSGSRAAAIRVPGLARKFWTITSWMCSDSASEASAAIVSARSSRVSPIPINRPVVNGMSSSPASRMVSRRASGRLSGLAQWARPRPSSRVEDCSSMIPWDALTLRRAASSSRLSTPGLAWGTRPVSAMTLPATWTRYSTVVSKPMTRSSSRATL